ncbi:MAG: response regulator [Nitrospirae bacterium]|nr:response regulator [Nitrospirota bacterium]
MAQRNILVVDDSAMMRQLISMAVRKVVLGVSVSEAANGRDALAMLRARHFDLVLTDMQMPEMDGGELIKNVRRDMGNTLPIIVVTTKGEELDRESGIASGADSYLTKPVNPQELRETVNRYLK